MRNSILLTAVACLYGCNSAPNQSQPVADQWVDEQIALSASSISQAQNRLHQSSPAPAAKPVAPAPINPATPPVASVQIAAVTKIADQSKPVAIATSPNAGPTASALKVAPNVVTAAPKSLPSPSPTPPAVVAPIQVLTAAPKPVAPAPIPKPVWEAHTGDSLRKVITSWSQRANYTLDWQADDLDYPIDAPLRFEGSFEDAIAGIFRLYEQADRSFIVDGRRAQHRLNVAENRDKSKRATP